MNHTNYRVIAERTVADLQREVQYYLNRGWKLQGGVSAVIDGSAHCSFRQ